MYLAHVLFLCVITTHKIKFLNNDFFTKRDHIRSFLRIWSYSLKKYLMENYIFSAVYLK